MKLQGRKFVGMLIGLVANSALVITGYIFAPQSIDSTVLIFAMATGTTLITAFIGGNVWSSWIKSKYFVKELRNEK